MSRLTILIADDDSVSRQLLAGILKDQGYDFVFAADGPETLAKTQAGGIDLLLLDNLMPGMDGVEVCRQLRLDPALAELPILIITAKADRSSRLRALAEDADDYIAKPYDAGEIRARVQTIARINRYRSLSDERLKLAWVLEQADDGYLTVDANDVITFANQSARMWLHLGSLAESCRAECFLESARRYYLIETVEAAWKAAPNFTSEQRQPLGYFIRPESETEHALWLRVERLTLTGGPQGSRLVHLRDVTSLMNQQLDLWTLRGALSHKLLTPLNGLCGCLEVLEDAAQNPTSELVGQLASMAIASGQRLQGAITGILQFFDAPKLARIANPMFLRNLPALLDGVSEELKIKVPEIQIDAGLENQRLAISVQAFSIVVSEYLKNAKAFHPQLNPTIQITVAPADEARIKIRICDDGVNLSPAQLVRAWTPFYQAEKHFTGEMPGMGLGLPMTAAIIWQSGGSCQLRNRDDGQPGVMIEMLIPFLVAPRAATPA